LQVICLFKSNFICTNHDANIMVNFTSS
jgi:hypothetical protein